MSVRLLYFSGYFNKHAILSRSLPFHFWQRESEMLAIKVEWKLVARRADNSLRQLRYLLPSLNSGLTKLNTIPTKFCVDKIVCIQNKPSGQLNGIPVEVNKMAITVSCLKLRHMTTLLIL